MFCDDKAMHATAHSRRRDGDLQMQFICVLCANHLHGINQLFVQRHIKLWQVIRPRRSPADEALPDPLGKLDLGNFQCHFSSP